jgi:hypothetical protein
LDNYATFVGIRNHVSNPQGRIVTINDGRKVTQICADVIWLAPPTPEHPQATLEGDIFPQCVFVVSRVSSRFHLATLSRAKTEEVLNILKGFLQ